MSWRNTSGERRRALPAAVALCLVAACSRSRLVTRPTHTETAFVIRNVRVFDAASATLAAGFRDVVVRDGRIAAVPPAGSPAAGLTAIDGRGGTLLPGLIDVHAHTGGTTGPPWLRQLPDVEDNLAAYLYAGVTTVLDAGSFTPAIFRLRDRIRAGRTLGPHLYAAGPMFTAPGGHPVAFLDAILPWWVRWYALPRLTRQVATPDDARAAVGALLAENPDVLKVVVDRVPFDGSRLTPDAIAAITAAGHAAGVRSVAHIGRSQDAIDAVRGGVDALLHSVYLEDISDEAVATLAAAHVPVAATLGVFDVAERGLSDRPPDLLPIEREVATAEVLAALASVPSTYDRRPFEPFARAVLAAHDARRRNVARLRAAGVTILVGSDAANGGYFPGAALHVELKKLVEAGMSPGEALRAATLDNARFLAGPAADFGEIAPGKRADLVLVDGYPVARIEDAARIQLVVLDGVPLERHPRPSH